MAYWEWGDANAAHVVLCVHGLSRQGRDFDELARALCARSPAPIRVVCPDVVGRGQSDWLADPMAYQLPTYAADMLALLSHLKASRVDWVGTSMGGLIGLVVAAHCAQTALAQAQATPLASAGPTLVPIRRLVLNDVGPVIEWQALERIGQYLGHTGRFDSLQQACDAMWAISRSFGPHTPEQWLALSRPMVKPINDGSGACTLHYDPAIAKPFASVTPESAAQGEAMLWQLYDAVSAQTLLLRGAESDLLSRQTAQAMTQRGPKARLVEFAGVGHAPTLVHSDQIDVVTQFLLSP
jgi:pimeloyl-ACP methyl ester carboxylesterase